MSQAKASLILVALVAGCALVQAAGGIKGGQRPDDSQQRPLGLKALRPPQQQQQQQQYQPPPQAQGPPAQAARVAPQQQQIKGPGRVTPVFTPARVQQPQFQQQQEFQPQQQQQQQIQQQQQQVIQQQEQEPEPQQQQSDSEIDPNAAAQDSAPALAAPANNNRAAAAAASEEEANPRPEPYAFQYAFDAADSSTSGSSQREEQQDASGKVTGFYTLKGEDGRDRRVDYIADANGFRATISTNEMGTLARDSADVNWQAQSPSEGQLRVAESATQAARQRALSNPQSASGSQLSKVSSPRHHASKANHQQQQQQNQQPQLQLQQQPQQQQQSIAQLQEPFEQIRQTELNGRARKSRHAPFYLYTI